MKSVALRFGLVLLPALVLCSTAQAVDWKKALQEGQSKQASSGQSGSEGSLGALAGGLGGLSLPGISGDTAGNVAGVLQYCAKRKYLSADAVTSVKDKLLSKYGVGGEDEAAEETPDYQSGVQGLLKGDGGKSFNLDSVSDKLKDKACDYVLDNATKLI